MNILYLSCHSVLEYDELRMLSALPGVQILSPGGYWEPEKGCGLRPGLQLRQEGEWKHLWSRIQTSREKPDHKDHITREAVEPFDVIIVMKEWRWVFDNWEAIKHKKVVWRDIGQTVTGDELENIRRARDLGVTIVRYWDGYCHRNDYQGHDAVIPFGKFSSDFPAWNGETPCVMGLCQSILPRREECHYLGWRQSTSGLPKTLYGSNNPGIAEWAGEVSYGGLLNAMSCHRCMWYGGTFPAPYTLGLMEAMFVGIPVFTLRSPGWETAIHELLPDVCLFDNYEELRAAMHEAIFLNPSWLNVVSSGLKETARKQWDAKRLTKQWESLLNSL